MRLPQANVELLSISAQGHARDYDRPAGDPVVKWQGRVGAYLQEKLSGNPAGSQGGELNRLKSTTLIIPGNLTPAVDLRTTDVLTYRRRDGATGQWVTETRRVQAVAAAVRPTPGLPSTVRLSLIDASA